MLSAIGLIIAIALLIVMIVKGVDMITASVVTAAIILVTSGLDFWEGLLKTFSEGAGSFCSSWFLILALGGIFGELVNQTGLATKVAKSLSAALGAKRVGLIIMICTFFITLLGINGYIMVFVLYPIADSLLRENKMDRRLLPFLMIAGGANANGFAFSMDICNVIPSNFLGTSLGVAPVLAVIFSVITCTWYVIYFNYAQMKSMEKMSEAELMALYKTEKSVMGDNELPGLFMSLLPFILVLAVVVVTSGMGTSTSLSCALLTGVLVIIVTQFKKIKNLKGSLKGGAMSGLSTMLTVAAVIGLSKGPDPGTGFPCCTGVCIKYYTSDLLKDLAWNHDLWSYDWFCDYSGNPVFGELRKTVPCSWREYQCPPQNCGRGWYYSEQTSECFTGSYGNFCL